ncbi:MAG TPA: PKD domain-containing protein [Vicinamibacteria bacterium]|nr:PKD domain-containing protein [Vicinamibacteria bacterium]
MHAHSWRRSAAAVVLAALLGACGDEGGGPPTGGTANRAPTATIAVSRSTTLAQVMTVSFQATGSDPDGDPVTYAWNFGDGGSASGASVSRLFANPGSFNVTLTVTDGRGGSGSASTTIVSKRMDALWLEAVSFPEGRYGIDITQQGTRFTGRVISPFAGATGPLTGEVTAAGAVTYEANYVGFNYSESFSGQLDPALDRIPGTVRGSNGFRYDAVLIRQP